MSAPFQAQCYIMSCVEARNAGSLFQQLPKIIESVLSMNEKLKIF